MFLDVDTIVLLVNDCEIVLEFGDTLSTATGELRIASYRQNINKISAAAFTSILVVFGTLTLIPILALGDTLWGGKIYFTPRSLVFKKKIINARTGLNFCRNQLPRVIINTLILGESLLRYLDIINLRQWLPFVKETFYKSRLAKHFGDERNIIPDIRKKSLYKFGKNTLYSYYKWTKPYEARSLFLWLTVLFIVSVSASKVTETHIILTVGTSLAFLGGAALFISRGAHKASKLKWLFTWNNKYTHQVTNAPLDALYMRVLHAVTTVSVILAAVAISTLPILTLIWAFWH